MTGAFRLQFPALASAVERRTRWRLVDAAALAAMKHRFVGARASELWVFATLEEFTTRPAELLGIKYVLFEKLARGLVWKTAPSRSKFNVGEG